MDARLSAKPSIIPPSKIALYGYSVYFLGLFSNHTEVSDKLWQKIRHSLVRIHDERALE